MKIKNKKFLATVLFAVTIPFSLQAQEYTWTGATNTDYGTATNWSGGVPVLTGGDTALINNGDGVIYDAAGGDFIIQGGSTLQISNGSWTQTNGIAWTNMSGGNLLVDGGSFDQGTAGNFLRNASSSIIVSGGELSLNGNLVYETAASGNLSLSGTGIINVDGEFKPIDTFSIVGGTLNVSNLISFADGPGSLNLSGGSVSVDGAGANSGFYGGSIAKSLNFTTGSTGKLVFRDYTLADLGTDNFLNNGTITLNGAVSALDFTSSQVGLNVEVNVIPEPSSILMILTGMGLLFITLRRRK